MPSNMSDELDEGCYPKVATGIIKKSFVQSVWDAMHDVPLGCEEAPMNDPLVQRLLSAETDGYKWAGEAARHIIELESVVKQQHEMLAQLNKVVNDKVST